MLHESVSHETPYHRTVAGEANGLTIDELAHRVGMTARNVRAYQSRGLIPPPTLKGRTGYYDPEHVARLELIRDLQAEGFNLESIKRILERAPGGSLGEVLDFTRAAAAPFGDEAPEVVDGAILAEQWGDELTPELIERIERHDFVRPLGDNLWEVRSPRLNRAAQELFELGVPFAAAVDVMATLKRHSEAVARKYVELFLDHLWRPFEEAGEPPEEFARVREALERLRPLAGESLLAVFQVVMTDAVEAAIEREVSRMGESAEPSAEHRRPRRGSGRARRRGGHKGSSR
jgi:DNA-binding transcriptional MerR regulator